MTALTFRPRTLHEVSRRVAADEQPFDPALREFLDEFYAHPMHRMGAIAQPPLPLDALRDAYLGATAEHLASCYKMPAPAWTETYGMALTQPFFAGGLDSLKAVLTVESPAAFRRRLLFVSQNALSRAREDAPD